MGIRSGIVLITIGAILVFATRFDFVAGFNIQIVGFILMLTGAGTLALALRTRRRREAEGVHTHLPLDPEEEAILHEHEAAPGSDFSREPDL